MDYIEETIVVENNLFREKR